MPDRDDLEQHIQDAIAWIQEGNTNRLAILTDNEDHHELTNAVACWWTNLKVSGADALAYEQFCRLVFACYCHGYEAGREAVEIEESLPPL